MKAVHFSTTDYGGAYRAAERISRSLELSGVGSQVMVRTKTDPGSGCREYFTTPGQRLASKIKNAGNLLFSRGKLVTDLFGTDVSVSSYVKEADVVFLHWVNSFISYRDVKKLVRTGKRIVWVMHDMWVFTEGYHYTNSRNAAGSEHRFLSQLNLSMKKRAFSGAGITFVAVSEWLNRSAAESDILRDEKIITIHNPLDTDKFVPLTDVKDNYTDGSRKIILFGADKATGNPTKGFGLLIEALKQMDGERYCAICFGSAPENSRISLPNIKIIYTGSINDDSKLTELYNLADVMVTPSIQEAFGYTCCEALSCGTPVAAFDTSGLKDQIIHKGNGYLARPFEPDDLAVGIRYCIENHDRLSEAARRTAVANNSYAVIGEKYRSLIQSLS